MEKRINNHNNLQLSLAYMSDKNIIELISGKVENKYKKWGINKIIKVNNKKVFIKGLPLARKFVENRTSANLYNLPAYYNYGYGSAGCNPWRELLLHLKTTKYVSSGELHNFPLLHHYRIVEYDDNYFETGLQEKLMKRYHYNKNIKKYLQDRAKSKYKIILFLEYIPYVGWKYLQKNASFVKSFYEQSKKIISFIHKKEFYHNDAHLGNFLIDKNEQIYLTDFGLSLDKSFDLDKGELKFIEYNKKLDNYYMIDNVFSNFFNRLYYNKKLYKKFKLNEMNTLKIMHFIFKNFNDISEYVSAGAEEKNLIMKHKKKIIYYLEFKKKMKQDIKIMQI